MGASNSIRIAIHHSVTPYRATTRHTAPQQRECRRKTNPPLQTVPTKCYNPLQLSRRPVPNEPTAAQPKAAKARHTMPRRANPHHPAKAAKRTHLPTWRSSLVPRGALVVVSHPKEKKGQELLSRHPREVVKQHESRRRMTAAASTSSAWSLPC